MVDSSSHPRARSHLRAFAITWTILCVILGLLAAWQVLELREGTDAMEDVGRGLTQTAGSLSTLAELPLVGDGIEDAAETVDGSGTSVQQTASELDETITVLALLVALAIGVLPTAPILFLWWLDGDVRRAAR